MSLAQVEGEGVVPALLRALRDASVEVAVAAVDALGGRPDASSVDALFAVLQNSDGYFNPVTRVAAISSLARRPELTSVEPLLAAVRDIDAEVSIAAIAVIAERMPDVAAVQLSPLLRDHSGYYLPIVRLAAANALERAGCLHAGTATELLQTESDPALRRVLERAQFLAAADSTAAASVHST
jgi:HEAT repeat protein